MIHDPEIAFPAIECISSLPEKGLLAAMPVSPLRRHASAELQAAPPLTGGLTALSVGPERFLAGPVLGAPQAVMALEELGRRRVKEVIFVGLAGSLGTGLKPGDLYCPEAGFSTEGTSAHYPAPLSPDAALRQKILKAARRMKITSGPIWTTDAIYRETASLVEKHKALGVAAVDMETTALWAAAFFRGIRLASLLVISDVLDGLTHQPGFHLSEFKTGLDLAAKLAWRALAAQD